MLYPTHSLSLALASVCAIVPSSMAYASFNARAPSHSYSVTNDNPAVKTTGSWGAFNTFAPLQGCPPAGMISAGYNSGAEEPTVHYNFTGSGISATLVSDQRDCTAVITVDGKDYELPVSAKAQGADCSTVHTPATGTDALKEGKHTAILKLNAREDGSRCQFVFVQFDVTTTSESFAPDPPNPSSSTGAGGTATTGSPGAAPTGSQPPGDDAAPSQATRSGLVAVAALTLGWLVSL